MWTNELRTTTPMICLEDPEGAHVLQGRYEEEVPGTDVFRLIRTCCGPWAQKPVERELVAA